MSNPTTDKAFTGSVPKIYEQYLVPLIFEDYAKDMVGRLAALEPSRVLEIAAGTGVVTRLMASTLPDSAQIVATDLQQPMIDEAERVGTPRPVEWRQADAMQLPFDDGSFDAVAIQFGAMFFPDRPKAYAEARRVLRPGGALVFNVWDRIEDNEFAEEVTSAVKALFPQDPPLFLPRTPYGYYQTESIRKDLAAGGFTSQVQIDTIAFRSRAKSARDPAIAYVEGTPLRGEIEARDASGLGKATDAATEAIARRFGSSDVDAKIQAHVITVVR